jgi:hypothetical protein
MEHVVLKKEGVCIVLLAPVVVSDLLKSFSHFAAERYIRAVVPERNVLDSLLSKTDLR